MMLNNWLNIATLTAAAKNRNTDIDNNNTFIDNWKIIIMIITMDKIFITKPQLKSYLQSTCCYKKSNEFIKTLSTIPSVAKETPRPSLENKNNPTYNKWRKKKLFIYKF